MDADRALVMRLSDPAALRVYAHPLRMRLVGLLRQHQTLTATQAAKLLDESSGSCSFHLRQLARYGLVEEVPAPGRAKPWRATAHTTAWSVEHDDPAAQAAARSLSGAVVDRYADSAREWLERRSGEPEAWREAAWLGDHLVACTAEELAAIRSQIEQLLEPLVQRTAEGRRPDDRWVSVVSFAVPMQEPSSG